MRIARQEHAYSRSEGGSYAEKRGESETSDTEQLPY